MRYCDARGPAPQLTYFFTFGGASGASGRVERASFTAYDTTLGAAGTVYVGNRGDFSVCAIDDKKLTKGACGTLDAMPDVIAYVAATRARDLLVVAAIGEKEHEGGWLEPLYDALYPDQEKWRAPLPAPIVLATRPSKWATPCTRPPT